MSGESEAPPSHGEQIARIETAVDAWWRAERGSFAQQAAYEGIVGAIALSPYVAGAREDLATIADAFISIRMRGDQQIAIGAPAAPPPDGPPPRRPA